MKKGDERDALLEAFYDIEIETFDDWEDITNIYVKSSEIVEAIKNGQNVFKPEFLEKLK